MEHKRAVHVKVDTDTGPVHLLVMRDGDSFKTECVWTQKPLLSWELIRESLDITTVRRINDL